MGSKIKKTRIAINALSATIGGGVTYLQNIIPALAEVGSEKDYYVFAAEENFNNIFSPIKMPSNVKMIRIRTYNLLVRMLQEQLLLPFMVIKHKIDVLICPTNILSFFAPCKKSLWVLNIYMYFDFDIKDETLYEKLRFYMLRYLTSFSMACSQQVIHISDYSRIILSKKLSLSMKNAFTVYLGVKSNEFRSNEVKGLADRDKYILSVSSISKRKNYEVLIRAFNKVGPRIQNNYKIVLIGHVTPETKEYLLRISYNDLKEKIVFMGVIDFDALRFAYENASLFVLPSLVEAFGIPVVEAMAAGIPVLVSNNTALPEIAGNAGMTFDPYDENDLAKKIGLILSDQNVANMLSNNGKERAKEFTWENTAKKTLKCIDKLMSNEN